MIGVFFRKEGDAETCIKRIRETGNYITARFTPYCYEIFHKTAGKGNALLRLADALGLSHAQTIGVGDSENDLTMLEAAGLGLCMSNGMDEAKRAADEIICNNDEHAMKYILEHYL